MDDEDVMPFDTDDPEEHVWTLATENDQQCARMWLARCELIVRGYALAAAAGRAEFVTCEMAATFFLDERTASSQLCEARQLLELPALVEAVQDGRVRLPHARAVLDELRPLDPALAARVLDDTLPRLSDQPPANVRKITRRAIVRADPAAAEARRQHATANRSAFVRPLPDGMADLTLNLRAETALRIHGLASAATAADDGSGRSADARRADWIVEQILTGADRTPGDSQDHTGTGAGGGAGVGAGAGGDGRVGSGEALDGRRRRSCQVLITMDVRTALGLDDEPCELDGYGTITAQHGRELLATAELRKVCLDPITGQVLHVDQTLHRPTDPSHPDRPHRPERPDPSPEDGSSPDDATGPQVPDDEDNDEDHHDDGDEDGDGDGDEDGDGDGDGGEDEDDSFDGYGSIDGADADNDDEGYDRYGAFDGADAETDDASYDAYRFDDAADAEADAEADDSDAPGRRGRDTQRRQPAAAGPGVIEVLRRMLTEPSWMPTADEPQYRPSAALTRTVRIRSATCTFPCCSTGSRYCDLDHRDPWPTGPTHADNLAPTSRRHHRAKQAGWTPFPAHDGGTLWQAPSGRVYRKPPGRPVPPGRRIS